MGASWADHKSKKTVILKCHHRLFCATTMNNFSIRLWQWILYNNWWPAQQLDGKEAPKLSPKPNLHQKRGHSHCWVVWSTTAFWIPAKPLHLRSMLSKLMRCTENCKACSGQWSTERAQFFTTTLDRVSYNQRFRSWTNWATKFCHIHLTSHQLTTTSSSISTIFCRENTSTISRMQKMLSKNLLNPEAQIFMLQE